MHRVEHLDPELRRKIQEGSERPEQQHVGGDRHVGNVEELGEAVAAGDDRHRLLGPHDHDRDDGHARAHGDLDEAAAAEPPQLVAVLVELAGGLGALRENEGELLLLTEQPVGVLGVGGHAAVAGPCRPHDRHRLEQVLGQAVHGPAELGLDAVHDRRGIRRDGAGVVRD